DPAQRLGRDQAKADSDSEQARIVAVRFDADVLDHDAWLPERDRAGHPLANQLASTHRIRLEQEAPQAAAELLAYDPLAGLGQQDQADRLAHVVFVRRERQPARRVDARREAQPLTEEMPSGFDHDEPQLSYDRRTGTQMRKNGSHQNAMFSAMTSTISRTKAHRVMIGIEKVQIIATPNASPLSCVSSSFTLAIFWRSAGESWTETPFCMRRSPAMLRSIGKASWIVLAGASGS